MDVATMAINAAVDVTAGVVLGRLMMHRFDALDRRFDRLEERLDRRPAESHEHRDPERASAPVG